MVFPLAVGAALLSALAGVCQRLGHEKDLTQGAGHVTGAMRRGIWWIGLVLLLGQFGLQATALKFGALSVVQPLLTADLLFLVVILATVFHRALRWREWLGAGGIVCGLAGFLLAAAPSTRHEIPGARSWEVMMVVMALASGSMIAAASRGPRWWRASAFGVAAALLFSANAAITKAVTDLVDRGWGHVFTHWEPYALGVTGLGGFVLFQHALRAGPIASSRAAMVIVNPLSSIVIGATVFSDRIRFGAVHVVLEAAALGVLGVGVWMLARSSLVSGATGDATSADLLVPVASA